MAAIFPGVSTENCEKFFMNMIVSDACMPHTKLHLSPITFSEFLIRNQVHLIAPFEVYKEANKVWQKFYNLNNGYFHTAVRDKVNMEVAEEPQGGWNSLVDYLNRLKHVATMSDFPYYQMHYMSIVSSNFFTSVDNNEASNDPVVKNCYRTIWSNIMAPILYNTYVPTQYAWLPIENFSDLRFNQDLEATLANVDIFIEGHSATMKYKVYDAARMIQYKGDIERTITAIHQSKYKGISEWTKPLAEFIARNKIRKVDMELCELYPAFKTNGMECVEIAERLEKLSKHYDKGVYNEDPDGVIDELLDIRPLNKDIPKNIDEAINAKLTELNPKKD